MSSSTPEETFINLTMAKETLDPAKPQEIIAQLKPAKIPQLTTGNGEWRGGEFRTGHPLNGKLLAMGWVEKLTAPPTMLTPLFYTTRRERERVWAVDYGHDQLRMVQDPEGRLAVTMIYDERPIIDYFYFVSETMVAGVMDRKDMRDLPPCYFLPVQGFERPEQIVRYPKKIRRRIDYIVK